MKIIFDQKGLSEIAMAPTLLASWSTLITAFWWAPHLWRQSAQWGFLFSVSAVICFVLLPFTAGLSYAQTHGIPSILTLVIGFGIAGLQVFHTIHLPGQTEPFTLQAAIVLIHGPVYLGCVIIIVRWILFKILGRHCTWLEMF